MQGGCLKYNVIVTGCSTNIKDRFGIGCDNDIPWILTGDMKYFRTITLGHVVIMGRKTWDSIPDNVKPLQKRINIVLTHNPDNFKSKTKNGKTIFVNDWNDAFEAALTAIGNKRYKEIFVIGGSTIFEEVVTKYPGFLDKLYITIIDKPFSKCNRFFNIKEYKNLLPYTTSHTVRTDANISREDHDSIIENKITTYQTHIMSKTPVPEISIQTDII